MDRDVPVFTDAELELLGGAIMLTCQRAFKDWKESGDLKSQIIAEDYRTLITKMEPHSAVVRSLLGEMEALISLSDILDKLKEEKNDNS